MLVEPVCMTYTRRQSTNRRRSKESHGYAFAPLFILFDKNYPPIPQNTVPNPQSSDVALLIPCYKSGKIIGATLEAATKIFPMENIFVIANGSSPTPLDNTAEIWAEYGTFTERIKYIGYTITSVGFNGGLGTLVQQAQDLEHKLSGLQRQFAGLIGSATFPHGAISMWDQKFLLQTFCEHPGFSVSEDWFFGHVARTLGSRIIMNSEVFVETETPAAIFWAGRGGNKGGSGEMTVWKQRFERWNFSSTNGLYWNMRFYETFLYLLTPFVLPISFIVRPSFCGYLLTGTIILSFNSLIFNIIHLRSKRKITSTGEVTTYALSTRALLFYILYKFVLTGVNVVSCYWSIFEYTRYFARRHPKVVEDENIVEVGLNLNESSRQGEVRRASTRRLTLTAVVSVSTSAVTLFTAQS
ncbi:hypothetical protein IFR05_003329 [Cadophora sp. M221]|nr:hypothetical protein IFR05_003329 [Cadophora sp. M221]